MKGKHLLRFSGILMILAGLFVTIIGIIALLFTELLEAAGVNLVVDNIALLIGLVGSVIQFIAGIIGVVNCQKPEAVSKCIGWGCLVAGLCVFSQVFNFDSVGEFHCLTLALGLIVPLLYIIGASMNKHSA